MTIEIHNNDQMRFFLKKLSKRTFKTSGAKLIAYRTPSKLLLKLFSWHFFPSRTNFFPSLEFRARKKIGPEEKKDKLSPFDRSQENSIAFNSKPSETRIIMIFLRGNMKTLFPPRTSREEQSRIISPEHSRRKIFYQTKPYAH